MNESVNTSRKPIFRLNDEQKERILRLVNDQLIWGILIIFFIVVSFIAPRFLSQLNITNILLHSAVLGIMVVGEVHCLIIGKVDLSIESTLGFTAMLGAILMGDYNWSPYAAIIIMFVVGITIGLFNAFMILRFKINDFIVTLGVLTTLRGLSLVISEGTTRYAFSPVFLSFAAHSKNGLISVPVLIMLVVYTIFHIILSKRIFGRKMYAVGGNAEAAYAAGINTNWTVVRVYVTSSVLATLGGIILSARLNSVTTSLGQGMVFAIMAAAVVGGVSMWGGRGNLIGALGGVLLLSSIDSALILSSVSTFWVQTTKGLILLIAVFLDAFKVRIIPEIRRKWLKGNESQLILVEDKTQ